MSKFGSLFVAILVFVSQNLHADVALYNFKKIDSGIFGITSNIGTNQIKLNITITNWRVNCTKTRAIIWGQTLRKLPVGVPPFVEIYVIDVKRRNILNSYKRTVRVHGDIEFDKANRFIMVDDDFLSYKSGKLTTVELASNFEKEKCENFPGRSLL
jgi:hypothetical protein